MGIFISLLFVLIPFTNGYELPLPDQPSEVCLSEEEVKLYSYINEYRKKKRLSPIPYSEKLSLVAQTHARDLSENYNFDRDNRCNPHSWSEKGNWSGCCYTNDHSQASCMWSKPEEIAGYEGAGFEIAYYASSGAKAREGLDGWIRSPAHNPLLINTEQWAEVTWNAIGVGIYRNYAVVWFGRETDPSELRQCNQ